MRKTGFVVTLVTLVTLVVRVGAFAPAAGAGQVRRSAVVELSDVQSADDFWAGWSANRPGRRCVRANSFAAHGQEPVDCLGDGRDGRLGSEHRT
jgi:hypothetical protein